MFNTQTARALVRTALCLGLSSACQSPPPLPAAPAVPPSDAAPRAAQPASGWFENEPEQAFAVARAQQRLVFADLWAPWCHTCLSMRARVLNDVQVPELATVVRLAIDTESSEGAGFLEQYPPVVWPTFYLIDPASHQVRGRWLGGASPAQLSRWLKQASSGTDDATQQLSQAISSLLKQKKYSECLELARTALSQLPPSVGAVDSAASALSCATHVTDSSAAEPARRAAEAVLARDCETRAPGVSADDQADACDNLRTARQALNDETGARQAAEQTLRVIETACAGASPQIRAIYDWQRSSALVYLGRADEAIRLLSEQERALPDSYNPPHYLARIYRDQARWAEGLGAVERALGKAYGPRRVALLGIKADLLKGAGRVPEARSVLQQQLMDYRALPAGQRSPEAEAATERKLRQLDAPPP
jgi:tetratricopeptide (TPR) repeat protein/thiol-disulfide isomerase/thioredoxin